MPEWENDEPVSNAELKKISEDIASLKEEFSKLHDAVMMHVEAVERLARVIERG